MVKKSQITARVACAIVASMVSLGITAATAPDLRLPKRPTLVVGIFVEGLQSDCLDLLRGNFGEGGFKRLLDSGVSIENVDFGPGIDATAATAMLISGSAPSVNGIPAAKVYSVEKKADHPVLLSASKIGNYSDAAFTPEPLLVSTLSDEIRIADGGIGQVHAIAPDAQIAIILAGHAGNSAYWISDISGKWVTSTFYRDSPQPVSKRNHFSPLASRLDTLGWTPSVPLDRYPDLPEYKKIYPFRHTFPARDPNRFKAFKTSAPANREVTSLAIDYITSMQLGQKDVTDMVNLSYTLAPYQYGREADNRIETMDAYLRLDADLSNLFQAIEKGPGMDHTLVFVAGTPTPTDSKREEERWHIPYGVFSPRRAISLLNMYLIALHGNGDYVSGFHNGYLYLNNALLKERDLDPAAIRAEAARLLTRMTGVSEVFTIDDILSSRAGDNGYALRRNTSLNHAGDLLVLVNPGWEITDNTGEDGEINPASANGPVVRNVVTTSPVYILSPGIESQRIDIPVDARSIAPTVARILRIRSPNAAATAPVRLR